MPARCSTAGFALLRRRRLLTVRGGSLITAGHGCRLLYVNSHKAKRPQIGETSGPGAERGYIIQEIRFHMVSRWFHAWFCVFGVIGAVFTVFHGVFTSLPLRKSTLPVGPKSLPGRFTQEVWRGYAINFSCSSRLA